MKNVNWKELIITHVEKGALGLAGLIVLIGLATTSWGTYDKRPDQFEDKLKTGKNNFESGVWPTDREKEFQADDPGLQVVRLFDGSRTYAYSTRWVLPLNKRKEKIKEPTWQRFEMVVADPGKMLMEMLPLAGASSLATTESGEIKVKVPGSLVERPRVEGPRVEGPRKSGTTGPLASTSTTPDESGAGYGAAPTDNPSAGGSEDPLMASSTMMNSPAKKEKRGEGRGTRFVAVRAVFPMKKQVEQLKTALNLESSVEAAQQLVFWDFELERQTAVAGANPWSGPWEKVDIAYALDLLGRTDFDQDIVDERFRDAVFTMPLPYRVSGNWASPRNAGLASHPSIKQVLTLEQQLKQEQQLAALVAADEQTENAKEKTPGGFGRIQHDTKSLARKASQNPAMRDSYTNMMKESGGENAPGASGVANVNPYGGSGYQSQGAFGLAKVTEISEVLLFRFLDFSVVPGNAYRYKIKLKIENPNFGREASELENIASREGEFRNTEWSEPSTPAVVQDETDFYIAKLDGRRSVAEIEVHEWMTDTGSYVNGTFKGLLAGDQIASWREEDTRRGGYKKGTGIETPVLRPYEETYDDEVIDFVTPNTLIDLEKTVLLDPADYPELELTSKRINVSLDEVVMVNRFGELVQVDSVSQAGAYKSAADLMKEQETAWGAYRNKSAQPQQTGIDSLLDSGGYGAAPSYPGGGGGEGGGEGGEGQGARRPSSLKRSSRR
jgi:hypothetical protein